MQIGIQLPEIERFVPWPEYRTMAIAAENVGFDSLWLGDHLLYDRPEGPTGPWECWSLLSAVAAVTDRVLLGPLVSPTGFRNPGLLAKMASTVDEVSGGRLVLGLGSGWNEREYIAFGFPFDRRVDRFEEAFSIITDLIRTGRSDFSGEHHRAVDNHLIPPARPDLPIMIGSTGPRMLGITASEMDWWNEWFVRFANDPAQLPPLIERVDRAMTEAGRDPDEIVKSVALYVSIGPDDERNIPDGIEPISGSATEISDQILAFSDLVDHVQLVVDPITVDSVEFLAPVVEAVHRTQ